MHYDRHTVRRQSHWYAISSGELVGPLEGYSTVALGCPYLSMKAHYIANVLPRNQIIVSCKCTSAISSPLEDFGMKMYLCGVATSDGAQQSNNIGIYTCLE